MSDSNLERITLHLEGDDGAVTTLSPRTLRGVEELGALFRYDLVARVPADRGLARRLLGQRAQIVIRGDLRAGGAPGASRTVTGMVTGARVIASDDRDAGGSTDFFSIEITVRPLAFRASLGVDRRVFRDLDVLAIARKVFDGAGIALRVDAQRTPTTRVYTVQQDESDWAFVLRLFEEEGIYTWFDHEQGSILVAADHSPSAPDHGDATRLLHRSATALNAVQDAIEELGPVGRVRPKRVALGSFDPARPSFTLRESHGADDGIEAYDAPGGGVRDAAELKLRAQVARERAEVETTAVAGRATLPHLAPGRIFELEGHSSELLDGAYFVTSVRLAVRTARSADVVEPTTVELEAIPSKLPFRLARRTPVPRQPGLVSGRVVGTAGEEIDLDEAGRARVHHHWDRLPDAASPGRWSRVVQRGTTGSMLLPRVGWNVFAMSEEGSVDSPTILSRMVDAEHMPPYPLPGTKTRTTYKTDTSPGGGNHNEIHFEDSKGAEQMFFHASRDMSTEVGNDRSDTIKGYAEIEIGRDQENDVRATKDDHVVGDDTLTIGGNWTEDVAIDWTQQVTGSQSTRIGGTRKVSTKLNDTLSVGAGRDLKVGAAMLDVTLGGIKSIAPMHHVLVGGAVIKATPRPMTERVGSEVNAGMVLGKLPPKAQSALALPGVSGAVGKLTENLKKSVGISIQTVGAMKMEICATRTIEVSGPLVETWGPTLWNAPKVSETSHGPMKLTALKLEAKAKTKLTITSGEKVTLEVGSTVLEVTKDLVRLASKELQLEKGKSLSIKAPNIYVNAKGAP